MTLRFHPDTYQRVLDEVATALAAEEADDCCLEQNDCVDPGGHLFLATGCEEVCLHCRRRTWRR